jgi:hypothetical protein
MRCSDSIASRTAERPTSKVSISSRSDGNWSPGPSLPSRIISSMRAATSS